MLYDQDGKAIDYRFLEINPAFGKLTGLTSEAGLGKKVSRILPDEYRKWVDLYAPVAELGESISFQEDSPKLNRYFNVTAFSPERGKFATIFTNITEQKALEERLRQSEKMEAVGLLAGGIAHDFNNQLGGILGYAELLQQEEEKPELRFYIEEIIKGSQNASELIKQLLAFARKGHRSRNKLEINALLDDTLTLLRHTIDKKIEIKKHSSKKKIYTTGDFTQLQNALVNLGINARDAMPDGGILSFKIRETELAEKAFSFDIPKGRYVELVVKDTGIGMDKELQKRIFEPFYTTQKKGSGTGLGMSAVYGTVKAHGGAIHVYSKPSKGSEIKIYLPISGQEGDVSSSVRAPEVAKKGQGESILVVDDEDIMRQMLVNMLHKLHYKVTAFESPVKALEYYSSHWTRVNLAILDMSMPEMNGRELATAMRDINPGLKAILSSGFALKEQSSAEGNKAALFCSYLQKPYRMKELS